MKRAIFLFAAPVALGFCVGAASAQTLKTVKEAMTTAAGGLKVIIARAECQLERQRRVKPQISARLKAGGRVVTPRFGVDPDVCTGDKSCMRFNGCPSLTLKDNPDPLREDPVAHVDQTCVGCGLCVQACPKGVIEATTSRGFSARSPSAASVPGGSVSITTSARAASRPHLGCSGCHPLQSAKQRVPGKSHLRCDPAGRSEASRAALRQGPFPRHPLGPMHPSSSSL